MNIENICKETLGIDAIDLTPDVLSHFRASNPLISDGKTPLCVVRPENPAQLQKLVHTANEQKFGLVTVSSSGRHYKGGISCSRDHAAVDLSSWKKVPWLNKKNRVCLIEPGVTYGELLSVLESVGMTISLPLAPRSGKSVVAAVMDREPSTWPNKQWDHVDPVASTEFIFGTGDVFTTGAAGGPGTLEDQRNVGGAHKCAMGPSQTEFQRVLQGAQGCMGITTWISFRTEFFPHVQAPRVLGSDDLSPLIKFMYEVQRPWLGEHSFILNSQAAAMLMTHTEPEILRTLKDTLPEYVCLQNIAGFERLPQERVSYQLKNIGTIADRHGVKLEQQVGALSARDLLTTATRPCGDQDWRQAAKGECLSVFFLSTLDRSEAFISIFSEIAKEFGIDDGNIGLYLQPVVQNHACHIEFMVPYNAGNEDDVKKIKGLETKAFKKLNTAGAFFSRPYGMAAHEVFNNNVQNKEFLKTVKNIFDPNHILNPGKFGI
jgi:FAD/FMN-containing dehydrogenase